MRSAHDEGARWRKSSRSANAANCVELTCSPMPAIRDSKNPDGPHLNGDWSVLIRAVKAGELGR